MATFVGGRDERVDPAEEEPRHRPGRSPQIVEATVRSSLRSAVYTAGKRGTGAQALALATYPAVSYGFGTCSQSTTRLLEMPADLDACAPIASCLCRAHTHTHTRTNARTRTHHSISTAEHTAAPVCAQLRPIAAPCGSRQCGSQGWHAGFAAKESDRRRPPSPSQPVSFPSMPYLSPVTDQHPQRCTHLPP